MWLSGLARAAPSSRSLDLTAEQAAITASERELQAIDVIAEAAAGAGHDQLLRQ